MMPILWGIDCIIQERRPSRASRLFGFALIQLLACRTPPAIRKKIAHRRAFLQLEDHVGQIRERCHPVLGTGTHEAVERCGARDRSVRARKKIVLSFMRSFT